MIQPTPRLRKEVEIRAVDSLRQGSLAMENLILRPNIFDVLIQKESGNEVMEVAMKSTALKGRALSKIRLPGNNLILFVKRGGDTTIPHGNTRLYEDDIIALCADLDLVRKARESSLKWGKACSAEVLSW